MTARHALVGVRIVLTSIGLAAACSAAPDQNVPGGSELRVTFVADRLVNNASGAPEVVVDEPEFSIEASVRWADGTIAIASREGDVFTIERPSEQPYTLLVRYDAGEPEAYFHHRDDLTIELHAVGRRVRAPVSPGTKLELPPALGLGYVASTGLWSATPIERGDPTSVLAWEHAGWAWGPRGLLSGAAGDVLYYFDFAIGGDGYFHTIARAVIDPAIEMLDAGTTTIAGPFAARVQDRCARLRTPRGIGAARLAALRGVESMPMFETRLLAAPTLETHPARGMLLATNTSSQTMDSDHTVLHNNPISGTHVVGFAAASVGQRRTYPGDRFGTETVAALVSYSPVPTAPSCAGNVPDLTFDAPIVESVTIDEQALSADDQAVQLADRASVRVAWTTSAGRIDQTNVTLFELASNGAGQSILIPVRTIVTTVSSIDLDPALLVADHSYVLQFVAIDGRPGADEGTFGAVAYPYRYSQIYSASFRVR